MDACFEERLCRRTAVIPTSMMCCRQLHAHAWEASTQLTHKEICVGPHTRLQSPKQFAHVVAENMSPALGKDTFTAKKIRASFKSAASFLPQGNVGWALSCFNVIPSRISA